MVRKEVVYLDSSLVVFVKFDLYKYLACFRRLLKQVDHMVEYMANPSAYPRRSLQLNVGG